MIFPIRTTYDITFTYCNHEGITARRTITPYELQFNALAPYYPEPTWLLWGYCHDRLAYRSFSLEKISNLQPASPK